MKLEFRFLKETDSNIAGFWYLVLSSLGIGLLAFFELIPSWVFFILISLTLICSQLGRIRIKRIKEKGVEK